MLPQRGPCRRQQQSECVARTLNRELAVSRPKVLAPNHGPETCSMQPEQDMHVFADIIMSWNIPNRDRCIVTTTTVVLASAHFTCTVTPSLNHRESSGHSNLALQR